MDDTEEIKGFLNNKPVHRATTPSKARSLIPWLLTAISWLVTLYILISAHLKSTPTQEPTEATTSACDCTTVFSPTQHFPTDLESLRSAIQYETVEYTGSLLYDTEQKRIYRKNDSEVEYVGPPNDAIDAAWDALLHDEFPPMTELEAAPFLPELLRIDEHYRFEPDMLHSLHCLNAIRMHIDKDYYEREHDFADVWPQEDFPRIHIDHCIDRVRQALMCHGDLSPSPLYKWEGMPLALGRGSAHTCRKWQPIRDWIDNRQKKHGT